MIGGLITIEVPLTTSDNAERLQFASRALRDVVNSFNVINRERIASNNASCRGDSDGLIAVVNVENATSCWRLLLQAHTELERQKCRW
jgi:hypothetical protein